MAIASMIIQPVLEHMDRVAAELAAFDGVTVHSATPNQQIIIVIEAPSLSGIGEIARNLEGLTGVIGVYPTYINDET